MSVTPPGEAHPWAAELGLRREDLLLLDCLARGLDDHAIALRLFTTGNGVRSRVDRLKPRIGARTRPHMVAIALTLGLIRLDILSDAPLNSTT